jgi:hypothetical protein
MSRKRLPSIARELESQLMTPRRLLRNSKRHTDREDAFMILYCRMEVQLRKLVCFVLRRDHQIRWDHVVMFLKSHNDWDPGKWIGEFDRLRGRQAFASIIQTQLPEDWSYKPTRRKLDSFRPLRNDVFHGVALTSDHFRRFHKDDPCEFLVEWISAVAKSMRKELGYGGLENIKDMGLSNDYRFPKTTPFEEVAEYLKSKAGHWLIRI